MFGFLLVVLLLVGAFMTVIVLLQAGKGGGLASMGGGAGTDSLIGGRQAATLLTKATWVSGGLFLTLALVLSIMSSRAAGPAEPVLRNLQAPTPPPAGASPLGGAAQPLGGAAQPQGQAPATGQSATPPTTGR